MQEITSGGGAAESRNNNNHHHVSSGAGGANGGVTNGGTIMASNGTCIMSAGACSPGFSCDEQVCVQNLVKEFRNLENQIAASGCAGTANGGRRGDNEAVESLLLLGTNQLDSYFDQDPLKRVADGSFPEVSISDVGDLLGEACLFVNSMTSTTSLENGGNGLHLTSSTTSSAVYANGHAALTVNGTVTIIGEHDDLGTCSSSNSPLSTSSAGDQRVSNGTRLFYSAGPTTVTSGNAIRFVNGSSAISSPEDPQVVPVPRIHANGIAVSAGLQQPTDFGHLILNNETTPTVVLLQPEDRALIEQMREENLFESPLKDLMPSSILLVPSSMVNSDRIIPPHPSAYAASSNVEEEDRALLMACLPDRPSSAPPALLSLGNGDFEDLLDSSPSRSSLYTRCRAAKRRSRQKKHQITGATNASSVFFDMAADDQFPLTITRSLDDLSNIQLAGNLLPSFFVKRRVMERLPLSSTSSTSQLLAVTPNSSAVNAIPSSSSSGQLDSTAFASCSAPEDDSSMTIDIYGQRLSLVDSPDLGADDPQRVYLSEVFENFFQKRHWDEFSSILETNEVKPVSLVPRGVGEAVNTITVQELNRLLADNQARADGFIRCLTLSSYNTDQIRIGDTVINHQERPAGELTSGIRTRRAQNEDIGYVEIDGTTVPSLVVDGIHWVRLVDVIRLIVGDDQRQMLGQALSNQLRRLRNCCRRLEIPVHSCSPNDKARLVVVASSFHNHSCLVLPALEAPRLVAYERQKKLKPLPADVGGKRMKHVSGPGGKKSRLTREISSSGSMMSDSDDTDSVIVLDADDMDLSSPAVQQPGTIAIERVSGSTDALRQSHDSDRSFKSPLPPGPLVPEGSARTRPFTGINYRSIAHLLAKINPTLKVTLVKSVPMMIAVCSSLSINVPIQSRRGPPGAYFDHLFVNAHAECIMCQKCRAFFNVRSFMAHFHAGHINNGMLVLLENPSGQNNTPFEIWRRFNQKLIQFKMNDLARYITQNLLRDKKASMLARKSAARVRQSEKSQQMQMSPTPVPKFQSEPAVPLKPAVCLRVKRNLSNSVLSIAQKHELFNSSGIGDWVLSQARNDPMKEGLLAELYGPKSRA